MQCLGTALMSDGVRLLLLLLLLHSPSPDDCHVDAAYTVQFVSADR